MTKGRPPFGERPLLREAVRRPLPRPYFAASAVKLNIWTGDGLEHRGIEAHLRGKDADVQGLVQGVDLRPGEEQAQVGLGQGDGRRRERRRLRRGRRQEGEDRRAAGEMRGTDASCPELNAGSESQRKFIR